MYNTYYLMKNIYLILVVSFLAGACARKTECKGYVYSKYHYPLSGVSITLLEYHD